MATRTVLFLLTINRFSRSFDVTSKFFQRNQSVILYSVVLAAVLFVINWLNLRLVVIDHSFEVYIGSIAVLFTGLGIWLGLKVTRPKTIIVKEQIVISEQGPFVTDQGKLQELNISSREIEVLELMAKGLSNQEIADRLFVSLSTIKSHSNNLFSKLEVKRRTQAVDQARKLKLIQ